MGVDEKRVDELGSRRALIDNEVSAQLICAFVFAYANITTRPFKLHALCCFMNF